MAVRRTRKVYSDMTYKVLYFCTVKAGKIPRGDQSHSLHTQRGARNAIDTRPYSSDWRKRLVYQEVGRAWMSGFHEYVVTQWRAIEGTIPYLSRPCS
jgi:hypothetical protein